MNTTIQITYLVNGQKVYQGGTFPMKGRSPEQVLDDWVKQLRRTMELDIILSVIIDGKEIDLREENEK